MAELRPSVVNVLSLFFLRSPRSGAGVLQEGGAGGGEGGVSDEINRNGRRGGSILATSTVLQQGDHTGAWKYATTT